jgi:phthalate 4,5-dioxygenase oxygenase subunit
MASRSEIELLIHTGPGTPCGDLMRRYWQPVALASELPPDGDPLPVKLLGEELVLFRDDRGRPGLLDRFCAHRGVDLSYGRCDPGGLRCLYHGWLYDVDGTCLEQPAEPAGSTFHKRIRQTAYPCRETGDLIFAYLGPGEPPELPELDFYLAPDSHRVVSKIFQESNYLQALEGTFDQSHLSILHRVPPADVAIKAVTLEESAKSHYALLSEDVAPRIETERTHFGFREYVSRKAPEGEYLKVETFVLPNLGVVPGAAAGRGGYQGNFHVPIDDFSHWKYYIKFREDGPLDPATSNEGSYGGEALTPDFRSPRNAENRYLQDRKVMKQHPFVTGMGRGFAFHDTWAVESPGPIVDRTKEHLSYTDKAVIVLRQTLLEAIAQMQSDTLPAQSRDGSDILAIGDVVPPGTDHEAYLAAKIAARRDARSSFAAKS